MAKRLKFDESGDTEDLQALFDSISAVPAKPQIKAVAEPDPSGDNDDLQALFDSVAESCVAPAIAAVETGGATEEKAERSGDTVFNRIGHMTRQLHDTLRELGYDRLLQDTANAIPDARQRLSYIATKTEEAASRVLNATDIAKPIQDSLHDRSGMLAQRWDKVFANQVGVADFKRLAEETRGFLKDVPQQTAATNAQLLEIMMAQDFQDLTGQVIKRVVELAQNLETQLLEVLVEAMPEARRQDTAEGLLNGPVINPEGRADVVADQGQVDELLESLGF